MHLCLNSLLDGNTCPTLLTCDLLYALLSKLIMVPKVLIIVLPSTALAIG